MESTVLAPKALLTVNDAELSVRDCLRYLQSANKLQQFIGDVLRQYILEQEIKTREDLAIDEAAVQQAVINFRMKQNLTDPKAFQEFLQRNGMDAVAFQTQITNSFKLEKLKSIVSGERLQEYFIERKVFLDRVILSRIIVDKQDLAEELKVQIQEGERFEHLAQTHSVTEDRLVNGMMGPVSRGTLPDEIRAKVDAAAVGEVFGPLQMENRWGLFRLEQEIEATLDNQQLQQSLRNELFERWLSDQVKQMTVRLQVPE